MATLVTFHAHPDDESIATGGVMAQASAAGHRVVLVLATRGELGEVPDGFLLPGEEVWERRVVETARAAEILGVARVEYLGYRDSGMDGEPTVHAPGSFWTADVEEAANRLADILREERADVLTVYDENGNYGHPDHVQVHRVGVRAAELAGTPHVFEATMNRDYLRSVMREHAAELAEANAPDAPDDDFLETLGMPEALLTTRVDVVEFAERKRAAMAAHQSQIAENSFFLSMPEDAFRLTFGIEWFIHRGVEPGPFETSLFASVDARG
ncbi:MAG TPA: PIG-L family deacetylase [Acidimicrobiia bacterium]|nr:PIG-L family deacetylase [Acidimicrobiia bacterium]